MAFVTDRFNDNNLPNPVQLADEEIGNVVKNMDSFCISRCCIAIECELSINGDLQQTSNAGNQMLEELHQSCKR